MDRQECFVDADIRVAESLPPAAYTEATFAALETATLWRNHWLMIPDADPEHLSEPGRRAPVDVGGAPHFLQRGMDNVLRCFPNVCTHAWHTLVSAPGKGHALACPQHGRTFDAEGRFLNQPGMPADAPDFPRPCDSLRALDTATWGPLTFARRDKGGPSLEEAMAEVIASLGDLPVAALTRMPGDAAPRTVAGNWKQHATNYLDQLHIPYIHGAGLARSVHLDSYRTEVYEGSVLQWATAKDPALGFDPEMLPERFRGEHRVFALWWFLAPNLTLNFYPWGLSVNLYEPDPERVDRTRFHWQRWSWDDEKAARLDDWHMDDVDGEDVDALAEVTRGLSSGDAVRGRFVPGSEGAVHWFHRRVYEALFATRSDDL